MAMEHDQDLVIRLKKIVTDELPLSMLDNDQLTAAIEQIVEEQTRGIYMPIQTRVDLVQQVYSSIRGFGLLDSIISDDTITEVMINGPDNIFIEKMLGYLLGHQLQVEALKTILAQRPARINVHIDGIIHPTIARTDHLQRAIRHG